jgi:hypothetical protein
MSRSRFQRPFAHIALLAMLALSLLPSAGRIAAALQRDDAIDAFAAAALCSPSGLGADSPAATLQKALRPDRPAPSAPSPHADDCAYCPLLGGLSPAVPTLALALQIPPSIAPPAITADALPHERLPGAPGARGPPRRV